ncbi:hypothetical protein BC826DRAFT_1036758, partial [Russula brevipes]
SSTGSPLFSPPFSRSFEHLLSLFSFLPPFRHGPDSPTPNRATASSCVSCHRVPPSTALALPKEQCFPRLADFERAILASVSPPSFPLGLPFLSPRLLRCPSGLIA